MNRMMQGPAAIVPMDLLGLQADPNRHARVLTITESRKENVIRDPLRFVSDHEVVLRLKDNPTPSASTNLAEVTATLLEQARAIDATFRTLGIHASIADIVRQMMSPEQIAQTRAVNPYLRSWLEADARHKSEEHTQRLAREVQASLATPLNKRFKEGFQRVF